jgi:ankyrin repeat protein
MSDDTSALLSFALNHARKRLRVPETGTDDDSDEAGTTLSSTKLLDAMISSAVNGGNSLSAARRAPTTATTSSPQEKTVQKSVRRDHAPISMEGPSATAQLLAFLVAAIARPEVVHADEAEASSDEEAPSGSEPTPREPPDNDSPTAPPPRSRGPTTFTDSDLDESLRKRARDPEALLGAVKELLGQGADVNARDADSNSPLYLSLHIASARCDADGLPLPRCRACTPKARSELAFVADVVCATPSLPPVRRTALSVIHELLRRGANPNARRHGATVCHHALRLGRAPLVQRLLREGAYPQKSGTREAPPASCRLDAFAEAHGFGDEAMIHMKRGLRAAAARDDARAAHALLLHGCPPENQLLFALVRKRRAPAVVSALLKGGADPNTSDALGTHLLTLSLMQGDVGLSRSLLSARADPTIEEDGQSILSLAKSLGTPAELVALLEAREGGGGTAHPRPRAQAPRNDKKGKGVVRAVGRRTSPHDASP